MAANIAQFPLPVIAGIGHERDETIVDRVAHMRVKTPTAAAAFLIGTFREQDGQLETWKNDFIVGVQELLHNEQNRQVVRISDFKRSVQVVLTGNRTNLKLLSQRLDHASENYIRNRQVYFDRLKMNRADRCLGRSSAKSPGKFRKGLTTTNRSDICRSTPSSGIGCNDDQIRRS